MSSHLSTLSNQSNFERLSYKLQFTAVALQLTLSSGMKTITSVSESSLNNSMYRAVSNFSVDVTWNTVRLAKGDATKRTDVKN